MNEELSILKNWALIMFSLLISNIKDIKEIFQLLVLLASFIFTVVQITIAIKKYKKDK